jgi:hypothetical protein
MLSLYKEAIPRREQSDDQLSSHSPIHKQWVFTAHSKGELRVDWEDTGVTKWTKHIGAIFEARFLSEHRKGSFPHLKGDIQSGDIARLFIAFVVNLKLVYAQTHATPQEVPNSTTIAHSRSRKYNRRWRVNIHLR